MTSISAVSVRPVSTLGSRSADVAVVGAGPAGSAAAITLARLGRSVILIDKAVFPRDKCCGDGLTTAALRFARDLGLDPARVSSWEPVSDTVVVDSRGRAIDLPLPADGTQFAASAKRLDLDAALVDLAVGAGAELIQGSAVKDVALAGGGGGGRGAGSGRGRRGGGGGGGGGGGVRLELESGQQVRAHYVIAADGMWSPVRKAVGSSGLSGEGYRGDWQAGRMYYDNVGPQARKLWVWFEPDMVPGYAWSFPLSGGAANVGYGVLRRPGQPLGELKGQRIDFLSRPHIAAVLGPAATPVGPWKAWPIPTRIGEATLTALGGRVLFVGDAARACDPMTGEGIAQAFETAILASTAAVQAGPDRPERARTRYERQLRWGMILDSRLAQGLSAVLARPTGSAKCLSIVDRSDWCRRNFVRWMFEDYPRAGLATPHRWRRHMFSSPGAYAVPDHAAGAAG